MSLFGEATTKPVSPFAAKVDESPFAAGPGGSAFTGAGGENLFAPEELIDNPFLTLDDDAPEGETTEQYSERVYTTAELAFKERASKEQKRMLDAVDTEYWFCIAFQSRAQKEQLLDLLKIRHLGEKYLYGPEVALALGLALDRVEKTYNISDKLDAKWSELARPLVE